MPGRAAKRRVSAARLAAVAGRLERGSRVVRQIDELVLAQSFVAHRKAACLNEAPRRVGSQSQLARASLGFQPPFDHGEGALGARVGCRLG